MLLVLATAPAATASLSDNSRPGFFVPDAGCSTVDRSASAEVRCDSGDFRCGTAAQSFVAPSKLPAAQHSPFQVHIDPRTGRGPMAIDTSTFTSGEATLNGGIRNSKQFWRRWSDTYGDTLSPANRADVADGLSPVVDDAWIKHFPEHAPFKGETLIHHHLDYGRPAIPVPKTVHGQQPGWGIWHPLHAGGS